MDKSLTITLDFSDREDLYEKLVKISERELRSVDNQIIYWLIHHVDTFIGFEEEQCHT